MPSQTLKNKQQEITNTNTKNYTNNKIFERKGKEQQSNNIRQRIQSSSAAGDLRSIQYPKSTYQGIQNKQQQEKTANKFNQIFRQRIRYFLNIFILIRVPLLDGLYLVFVYLREKKENYKKLKEIPQKQ